MKLPDHPLTKAALLEALEDVQARFLHLLQEIPEKELDSRPNRSGWTIKQELVHIVQVLEVIPAGIARASQDGRRSSLGFVPAGLRGWVNGHIIIPLKAKNETRETIRRAYQDAHKVLLAQLGELKEEDWDKGMPYPRKYRTVAQMAYRPVEHFEEHEAHIHRLLGMEHESG